MRVFGEEHEAVRKALRAFVEREVEPRVEEWEAAGEIPKSVRARMGALGFLGVEYDEKYGGAGADFMTCASIRSSASTATRGSFPSAAEPRRS